MELAQLFIFWITLGYMSSEILNSCFQPYCRCNQSKNRASCSNLTFVPNIPDYVQHLVLINNKYLNVSSHFLSNLTGNGIRSLILEENSIHHLTDEAFKGMTSLTHLEIRKEGSLKSVDVKNALNSLHSTSLETVKLEENNWIDIPNDMFHSQAVINVSNISLSGNKLWNYSFDAFSQLSNLRKMDWSNNRLILFDVKGLLKLQVMNLTGNNIVKIPNFCNKANALQSEAPELKKLILTDNALPYLEPRLFRCLPSLEQLNLDYNRFKILVNNTFSLMPRLRKLFIQHNSQLKNIESTAFNSSSLKQLYFGYNNFHFKYMVRKRKITYDPNTIFKFTPQLQLLDLTNNYLPSSSSYLRLIFRHLHRLTKLTLQSTALKALPNDVFNKMDSLRHLTLQGNYIQSWSEKTFSSMINLTELNLEGNHIHLVNKTSIPLNTLNKLRKLDLSNNPFTCTCDLMWFRDWIRTTNVSLLNFPHRYKCTYPEGMRGVLLEKYNPTKKSCNPWDPLYTMAIILSTFGFLILIVMFTAYKCHANVRNYFYLLRLHRLRKQGYLQLDNSEDFEYHAFVVYCDADREWVHNVLVMRLENVGLKLCIHHRDFDVGTTITENIENYMSKCWKVVVVMSNSFAESEWCQWEVNFVQERRRRQGKDAFLLIMLKTINSDHMTSPIKTLLETTPYLTFKKGVGEDLFWQAAIKCLRRPLSVPPMAV